MSREALLKRIEDRTALVGVVGLGYVGLPLAVEFGRKYPTVGFDVKPERVAELASGKDSTLEASPVGPRRGWDVPDALLGGLNAALVELGAVPGGTLDADVERRLFDGVAIEGDRAQSSAEFGVGFSVFVSDHVDHLPIELEVDLAGDEPVPVVGTIVNPQAAGGKLGEAPRDFELLLSADGGTWTPVLHGSLTPVGVDQAFVLDEPVPATHARLRILSKHLDQDAFLSIGEWKVVAEPGTAVGGGAIDIADAALGGHVVTMQPVAFDLSPGAGTLDGHLTRETIDLHESRSWEMVIGFQDGRAAQITGIEWVYPTGSKSDERHDRVEVSASNQGPTAPWRTLGTSELDRQAHDTVATYDL